MRKGLITIILSIFILGCSKEEEKSQDKLLGTWQQIIEMNQSFERIDNGVHLLVRQITFLPNNSYKSVYFLRDKDNQEELGYLSKDIGTYIIDDESIYYTVDHWYSNEEYEFQVVPFDDLLLLTTNKEFIQTYDFENNELVLGCGPLENCALAIYHKINKSNK